MTKKTDNSKLDKRPRAVQNGMSQAEYDTWMFLADKKSLDEPYTYAIKQSDLTKFLRGFISIDLLREWLPKKKNPKSKHLFTSVSGTQIDIVNESYIQGFNQALSEIEKIISR